MDESLAASPENVALFLQDIASPNPQVRYMAWRFASRRGARAVVPLGDLAASEDKGVAKAAQGALQEIAFYAGRPDAQDEARAVAEQLLLLTAPSRPRAVRANALHLLGFVADKPLALAIARLSQDPEVGEDARMALQRIPGARDRPSPPPKG
jgi:HEAT repeat protein